MKAGGWLQRPQAAQLQTASVILFSLVIFNIFIGCETEPCWLSPAKFLTVQWHTNYAAIVKGALRWALESEIQMGRPWVGRRSNAIFSKPLWFGNLTRNLLGSRFRWDSWSFLNQAMGLEYLGNSQPQGSQGSSFWLGWEVLSCMKSRTLEGCETVENLNRNFNCSFG